jgi:hypothetical protein
MADTQNPVYVDGSTITGDGTEEHPLAAAGGGGGVSSLNAETGAVVIESTGGTVAITKPSGSTINLEVANPILKTIVTLTSAQILALAATPVQLIASPGAGKFISVFGLVANYTAGTTPYTVGESEALSIEHGSTAGSEFLIQTTGFLDQAASQIDPISTVFGSAEATPLPVADMDNQNLRVNGAGSTITLGNGTLTFIIYYTIEAAA